MSDNLVYTHTYTYTKARSLVLDDHFELFLRCSEIDDETVVKMLEAAHNRELEAVGIYIARQGYMIAEVEFCVDWDKHDEIIKAKGPEIDTYLPGWKKGIAPEAYISAQRLVQAAREQNLELSSWIRVTDRVWRDTSYQKRVCKNLGYGGNVPEWLRTPNEKSRNIHYLEEATVTTREI